MKEINCCWEKKRFLKRQTQTSNQACVAWITRSNVPGRKRERECQSIRMPCYCSWAGSDKEISFRESYEGYRWHYTEALFFRSKLIGSIYISRSACFLVLPGWIQFEPFFEPSGISPAFAFTHQAWMKTKKEITEEWPSDRHLLPFFSMIRELARRKKTRTVAETNTSIPICIH